MTPDDGLLRSPYRAVRVVRAPEDGPWPGTLVSTSDDDTVVLVDVDVLGPRWWGWRADVRGHVLAPTDVVRRADGHDAALPACAERLEDFLRRRSSRMPLTPGECVTVGVSLLRGCGQLVADPDVTGGWWLDGQGMPVLATDTGDRRGLDTAAEVLRGLPVAPELQRSWDAAIAALAALRVTAHELREAEDALFAAAAPEPLVTMTLTPRSAVDVGGRRVVAEHDSEQPERSLWQRLIGSVDEEMADALSRATTGVWRRWRSRPGTRRAPLLVAGGAAAAVLIGGALWPTAGGVATSGAISPSPSHVAPESSGQERTQAPRPGNEAVAAAAPTADDVLPGLDVVGAGLLDERAACGTDATCLSGVVAEAGARFPAGAVDLPASERSVTLLDDFGGVAVLRVDVADGTGASQLVVITRREGEWLLRDVQDVTQQP